MGARSARRTAAVWDPFSSVSFESRDLLRTEKTDHFVGPWPPWKPNDGTSIHSASRAATDRTGRTERATGVYSPPRSCAAWRRWLGCQQEHEHDHGARQAHNPGARKGARGIEQHARDDGAGSAKIALKDKDIGLMAMPAGLKGKVGCYPVVGDIAKATAV